MLSKAEKLALIGLVALTVTVAVFFVVDYVSMTIALIGIGSLTFLTFDFLRWNGRRESRLRQAQRRTQYRPNLRVIPGGANINHLTKEEDKSA